MDITEKIKTIAIETGFSEAGYAAMENLKFYPEVRKMCEGNTCRHYASTWACPPAIGTLEECMDRIHQYNRMLLFSKIYHIKNSFDIKGMMAGMHDFKQVVDQFDLNLKDVVWKYQLLSNEGCERCAACTYPSEPCRFPQLLHHSLEGYGFFVNELAKDAGVRYNNGVNTVTFFGALLFNFDSFTPADKILHD